MSDTIQYCYLASRVQTKQLQCTILRHSQVLGEGPNFQRALDAFMEVCHLNPTTFNIEGTAPHPMSSMAVQYFGVVKQEMPTQYEMSKRDLALWQCNMIAHAQDYLLAVPIDGLGQRIGPRQFCAVLGYRLGIPLFTGGMDCPCCSRDMDVFGDHALHCANEVGLKFRHDSVRDTIADICYRAGIHAQKEVALGFLSSDGGELRPADVLIYNWDNGRDMCIDVTGISPFTGGGVSTFTPGKAISTAVSRKRHKYLDKCSAHGYGFGTFAFTTLGELGDETVEFLNRVRNYVSSHDVNIHLGNFLFQRIGVVIQKAVGAQLVARLPTSFL